MSEAYDGSIVYVAFTADAGWDRERQAYCPKGDDAVAAYPGTCLTSSPEPGRARD